MFNAFCLDRGRHAIATTTRFSTAMKNIARQRRRRCSFEQLESRALLSATGLANIMAFPTAVVYRPAQIASAYAVVNTAGARTTGNGSGQTIAIVDAYNDPNVGSDLATFDSTFGLAPPPGLVVANQLGGSQLPTAVNSGWAMETSLDVEWAHAMAPGANILLVEATSPAWPIC
jgi:subtilase family serine protease